MKVRSLGEMIKIILSCQGISMNMMNTLSFCLWKVENFALQNYPCVYLPREFLVMNQRDLVQPITLYVFMFFSGRVSIQVKLRTCSVQDLTWDRKIYLEIKCIFSPLYSPVWTDRLIFLSCLSDDDFFLV